MTQHYLSGTCQLYHRERSFMMLSLKLSCLLATCWTLFLGHVAATPALRGNHVRRATPIAPKVFIISMFKPEAEIWYGIKEFNILGQNISVPGFSPLFPDAHCTADGQICQMVTGEGEINAASGVSALVLSPAFNLTQTYFMVGGIAGINPEIATTGSVTFARYAVQVALQHEFDAREIPSNFSTGYFPQCSQSPDEYPQCIYGTEVFEVSAALQQIAIGFARTAVLNDTVAAQKYRALYSTSSAYTLGAQAPTVVGCDVATSDVYYSGALLSEAFANTTRLFSNNTATYCSTAQEDNATLEALLRGTLAHLVDFTRIIIMRTASDFDRPPPGVSPLDNLVYVNQGGYPPAVQNIYRAGVKVVMGIVDGWNGTFAAGVAPGNYVGDIFNSLGGKPDFGLPSEYINPSGAAASSSRRKRGPAVEVVHGNLRMKRKLAGLMHEAKGAAALNF